MPSYVYPQSFDLYLLQAELLPGYMEGRKLIDLMPFRYEDAALITWEQPDNFHGTMQLRGEGGKPSVIQQTGLKTYSMKPGMYGETIVLGEEQLTEMREPGTKGDVIDLNYLTTTRIQYLTERGLNQVENTLATLFTTGQFVNRSADGAVTHADRIANFNSFVPGTNWASGAVPNTAATPIQDMRGFKQQAQKGTSSRYGKDSKLLMNTSTFNDMLGTDEVQKVLKLDYGQTPMGMDGLNTILNNNDLPSIEIYDGGYYATAATATANATGWTYFLPRGNAIWLGTRPRGQRIGEFVLTRNMNGVPPEGAAPDYRVKNSDLAGELLRGTYTKVVVKSDEVPVYYRLDHGFNGGPALYYSTAVSSINYTATQQ